MAILLGGKSEREEPRERLGADTDAGILDLDLEPLCARAHRHAEELLARRLFAQSLTGVAQQIREDLDELVPIEREARHALVIASHGDLALGREVQCDGLIDELCDIDLLDQPTAPRVGLLGGHYLTDMLDMRGDHARFGAEPGVFGDQVLAELLQVFRNGLAARIVLYEFP